MNITRKEAYVIFYTAFANNMIKFSYLLILVNGIEVYV